jgi:hypothetical protein
MAYETKVILAAVADVIVTSSDLKEAYQRVAKIAHVEGLILPEDDLKKLEQKLNKPKEETNA